MKMGDTPYRTKVLRPLDAYSASIFEEPNGPEARFSDAPEQYSWGTPGVARKRLIRLGRGAVIL